VTWPISPLGELAERLDYGITAAATEAKVGPKFLRITDIQNGVVDWDSVPFCFCDSRSALNARLSSGDIVFARTGATTGKSFLIRECPEGAVFASYLIRLRLQDRADPSFISHFFRTAEYWAQITKTARGLAQPGVNATSLGQLRVPVPPLPEQRRIADILDKADELRAKCRAALAQLDTVNESLFLSMFGEHLENSRRFRRATVRDVVTRLTNGYVGPTREIYVDRGVPYLLARHVKRNTLTFDGKTFVSEKFNRRNAKSILRTGDVLLVQSGHIGESAVVPEAHEGHNCHAMIVITPNEATITGRYLSHFFQTPAAQSAFKRIQTGLTLAHLNCRDVARMSIVVPPLPLQLQFAELTDAVHGLKHRHIRALLECDALFASLQHRAFRGEL